MGLEENASEMARLAWACRRGMLELDVLLGDFLKNHYQDLSVEEKRHFADLLSMPDPDLFEWLMGHAVPEEKAIAEIVQKIIKSRAIKK
ncbi:MAG TPA: succinate dehydrogenase assembly factor 2 [Gammaproteobacteria bacterium]|jgi:antitoxin CptB|nr:succinate dehydrogenase assembly factor 2 [Gammaproteobacteria bacterium]